MNQENRYQPPKADVADVSQDESELATRGARFGAALIDGLLIAVIVFPIMYLTGYIGRAQSGSTSLRDTLLYGILGFVIYLVLHGILLQRSGQTIGKRVVGTRIVSVDDNAILPLSKILLMRLLPLTIAQQIPVIGGLFGLVDALFVFRADRRCVHDLIAGTKVINANAAWKPASEANS
jgi:uncharacterized RDD family membrane protein YckC